MSAAELTAYINGMIEKMDPDNEKPETKILSAISAAITKLVDEVALLARESERVREYLDELDCDLGELEADYYCCESDERWPSGTESFAPIIICEKQSDFGEQSVIMQEPTEKGSDNGKS